MDNNDQYQKRLVTTKQKRELKNRYTPQDNGEYVVYSEATSEVLTNVLKRELAYAIKTTWSRLPQYRGMRLEVKPVSQLTVVEQKTAMKYKTVKQQ